jgi:glyoxylase-like metal-dependent hydrolase (beta-lactamase superfamily II)
MCYYFKDLAAVFDGDTLFHGSVGRSDFPTGDGQALLDNIREKLFVLPDETKVFPGHDSETTIGLEKSNNMFF